MSAAMIIFGVLTILAACGVVIARQPVHSALFLVLTLFLVAVHFALLGAHFLAAIQVLVYAGAIMVLVIFVIMLLGLDANILERRSDLGGFGAAVATAMFLVVFWMVAKHAPPMLPPDVGERVPVALSETSGTTAEIGKRLFTDYIYPFELTSLLILAGIVGAVVLGAEKKRPLKPGRGLKAKQVSGMD